jgi:hypothetical protein
MKRINIKNSVIAMAIAVALFAVSCGGSGGKKPQQSATTETKTEQAAPAKGGGTELKNVDEKNWQAVVKANFGVDVAVPAGWTFKSVKSPNGVNNLIIAMTIGEGTTGEAEGKRLFAATKAVSKYGNFKGQVDWEAETVSAGNAVNDIGEVDAFSDSDVVATWNFTFNSRMIIVNYTAMGNAAEYTFTVNNR